MRKLIWLASFPKSGNTWVRMFVAAYLSRSDTVDLNLAKQFSRSESLLADFARVAGKKTSELTQADVDQHRLAVQEHLSRVVGQRVVKTHNAQLDEQRRRLIFSRFTRAAIYVVRNPLDIADSLADHTNQSLDAAIRLMNQPQHVLRATDKHAAQYVGTWSHHVRTWTQNKNEFPLLVLRYEDLQAAPQEHFGRLIKFLGWDFDEAQLRRAVELTSFAALQQAESQTGFAETSRVARSGRFFRHGEAGRWREVLSDEQAAQIVRDHGAMMQEMRYEIPDSPLASL